VVSAISFASDSSPKPKNVKQLKSNRRKRKIRIESFDQLVSRFALDSGEALTPWETIAPSGMSIRVS
jgi:hypothetical protein